MNTKLTIGTRASKLALWQAERVKFLLETQGFSLQIKKITTKGDQILDRPLYEVGGKGLFLKEIEEELLAGKIDLAVHSLKDVPFELTEGLEIAAILEREDPCDAFVSRRGLAIKDLEKESVIGTSSLRRKIQLQKRYPHLKFKEIRGNVDTRLKKLEEGAFDGIVLAVAGLKRLGLSQKITQVLNIVPAVGQGAIGIEIRSRDGKLKKILLPLHHAPTAQCVSLEREYLKAVQGDCQTPLGCHVTFDEKDPHQFHMRYFLANPDGSDYHEGKVSDSWEKADRVLKNCLDP